ncbi:divalent-cation tolerance protein CutA [Microlunatus elymi]|uniref:Divalent-cation tolerance protein CutA n=1 Tax=Microlunatus elymi TaxID=2596828 RepID=A0A516PUY4_9ACTN|nr:divalent-cation tolerance protein CutA [Microlunatus elymi]QDP94972.1 divalent-cation tolerance protein CutA [Microlunatus elymi]
MTAEFCQVHVTFDDRAAAQDVVTTIVGERLAACAQIDGPITSTYWWDGKPETAEEWRAEFKTRTDLLDQLTARVVDLHTYDTPQVVAVPVVGGLDDYLKWMRDETTSTDTNPTSGTGATG